MKPLTASASLISIGSPGLPVYYILAEHAHNDFLLLASRSMRSGNVFDDVGLTEDHSEEDFYLQQQHQQHQQHHQQHHQHHHLHQHSYQHVLLTVEGVLVLLLYISLVSEIISIARERYYYTANHNPERKVRFLRHVSKSVGNASCGICHDKRGVRSLDTLWRRMQKATNQMQLVNLRHHMITKLMMEARMQARERERQKMHQKKEKLFANILTPLGKTVRIMGRSFDRG